MGSKPAASFSCLLLAMASAPAQGAWLEPNTPAARVSAFADVDPALGVVRMFGGFSYTWRSDLWQWDGAGWARMSPELAPGGIGGFAFDPVRRRSIVFRELGGAKSLEEHDGVSWMATAIPTGAITEGRLVFDHLRGRMLLIGRFPGSSVGVMYAWNGTNLQQIATGNPYGGPYAYDFARNVIVSPWSEYDGTTWHALTNPWGYLNGIALAFDPTVGRIVLVGSDGNGHHRYELLANATWIEVPLGSMPARDFPMLVPDLMRNCLLLFGGGDPYAHGDLWESDGTTWTRSTMDHAGPVFAAPTHAMVDAPSMQGQLLFGFDPIAWNSATWLLQDDTFTQLAPAQTPSPRHRTAMVWDSTRQRAVLFGGTWPATGALGDAFEFAGGTWQPLAGGPPPRSGHAMSYDSARDRVVLYGGNDANAQPMADTWEFDGTAWQVRATQFPPNNGAVAMAYDARRQRHVMACLGLSATETWEWDGTSWHSTNPAHRPGWTNDTRCMSYDAARARTMLLDGTSGAFWEWNGVDWAELPRDTRFGSTNASASMAYDAAAQRTVAYDAIGGRYAQWFFSIPPAAFAAFGSGCGNVPMVTTSGQPWLGDTVTLSVSPLAPGNVTLLATGFSLTSYQGTPLPHPLQPYGWPGCDLHAGPDVVFALTATGGQAQVTFALPQATTFVGFEYAQQVLSWNPSTSGLSTSAGYRTRLGLR